MAPGSQAVTCVCVPPEAAVACLLWFVSGDGTFEPLADIDHMLALQILGMRGRRRKRRRIPEHAHAKATTRTNNIDPGNAFLGQ